MMREWNPGRIATAVVLVLLSGALGHWGGGLLAAVAVAAVLAGARPRSLLLVALGCVGLTVLSWLAGNARRLGTVSFDLVTDNPWPQRFAVATVILLMLGVFLEPAAPRATPGEPQ